MSMQHYRTLGLTPGASEEEVKKAYRKLASIHHPDKGGETQKFQEIQTAYDAILNPKEEPYQFQEFGDLKDLFKANGGNNPFANFHFSQRQVKNPDVNASIVCTLEEAHSGFTRNIEVSLPDGVRKTLVVTFPAGSTNSLKIRYAGDGPIMIKNHPPGDIYVHLDIQPHGIWQLKNGELYTYLRINVWQAMFGGDVEITDITGSTLLVAIPAGTQSGAQIRLKARGFNVRGSAQRSNAYLSIEVVIPKLSKDDKEKKISSFLDH